MFRFHKNTNISLQGFNQLGPGLLVVYLPQTMFNYNGISVTTYFLQDKKRVICRQSLLIILKAIHDKFHIKQIQYWDALFDMILVVWFKNPIRMPQFQYFEIAI